MYMSNMKESDLRDRLGIGKPEMKAFREKAPAGYWEKEKSNKPEKLWAVIWSDEGVEWLSKELNVKTDEVKVEPEEVECKVLKSGFMNQRLVQVEKNGVKIMAVCKDNRLIKPNVIVKVRFRGGFACVTAITKNHMKFKA
jgi:hypothetical protein